MGKYAIHRIPYSCVACTSMLDKPWISGIPSEKQERYKPVTKCTYWPVLGAFNNWNILLLSSKSTSSDTFDEIPYIQGLYNIDVQATHEHGIRRISHLPIPSFGSKRKW